MNLVSWLPKFCAPGNGSSPSFGKPALHAERHAGAVEQDGGLEAFAMKAQRLKHIDQADRAFERDGVKRHQSFFARLRFDVLKDFFFVVDQKVTLLMRRHGDGGHDLLLAKRCRPVRVGRPTRLARRVPIAGMHIHSSNPVMFTHIFQSIPAARFRRRIFFVRVAATNLSSAMLNMKCTVRGSRAIGRTYNVNSGTNNKFCWRDRLQQYTVNLACAGRTRKTFARSVKWANGRRYCRGSASRAISPSPTRSPRTSAAASSRRRIGCRRSASSPAVSTSISRPWRAATSRRKSAA